MVHSNSIESTATSISCLSALEFQVKMDLLAIDSAAEYNDVTKKNKNDVIHTNCNINYAFIFVIQISGFTFHCEDINGRRGSFRNKSTVVNI